MTSRPALALVVSTIGCGQVFGIDTVPLPQPYDVDGTIAHDVVEMVNMRPLTEVIHPDFAAGEIGLSLSYEQTLDEPVGFDKANKFAFQPKGPYALAIRRGTSPIIQLDGDETASTIAFDFTDIGRPDPRPLPSPSPTLSFAGFGGFIAEDVPVIESTSIYTETILPAIGAGQTIVHRSRGARPASSAPRSACSRTRTIRSTSRPTASMPTCSSTRSAPTRRCT